jgi:hypothetical protein
VRYHVGCTVRGMVTRVAVVGALAVMLAASFAGARSAGAQESRPGEAPSHLELKREAKPPRPIVRPESDRSQAVRDAASAAAEYEQRQRDEALAREQTRPAVRRPDLGYDVTGGIQQRNIQRR